MVSGETLAQGQGHGRIDQSTLRNLMVNSKRVREDVLRSREAERLDGEWLVADRGENPDPGPCKKSI